MARVQRHRFLPEKVWIDDDRADGGYRPVDRRREPDLWWNGAYGNVAVVAQVEDGQPDRLDPHWITPTSSASLPSAVAQMAAAAELVPELQVLEIGDATGYNLALIGEIVGQGLDGAVVDGTGGVDAATMETMTTVPCVIPESVCLTPDQQVRLLAVAFAVTGAVRLLTNDPGTAILHGLLTRTCAVLTTPPVRTVSLCHRTLSVCHRRLSSLLRDYPVRHVAHTVTPCRAATAPQCGWSSGCTRRSTSGHE